MFRTITYDVPAPGFGIGAFPLEGVCRRGNVREPGSYDILKANWFARNFVSISQVVAVAQLCLWATSLNAEANLGDVPSGIEQYVSRMNLYRMAGIAHHEAFSRHPGEDRFLPMERVTSIEDAGNVANRMIDILMSRLDVDSSVIDSMNLSFGEVMDNIVQHSGSVCGGLAAAQYYPNTTGRYLEICVSDCGRGIAESMRHNPEYRGLSDCDLVVKAFERGCGEKVGPQFFGSDDVGMGMGLAITERIVNLMGGVLWVISKGQMVRLSNGLTSTSDDYWFPGTIIVMRVPMIRGAVVNAGDVVRRDVHGKLSWNVEEGLGAIGPEGTSDALLW